MGHAWFCGVKKQGGRKSGRGKGKLLSRDRKNLDVAGNLLLKVLANEKRGGVAVVSFDRSGFKLFSL
jgi:hypothetical protein